MQLHACACQAGVIPLIGTLLILAARGHAFRCTPVINNLVIICLSFKHLNMVLDMSESLIYTAALKIREVSK